MSPDTSSRSLPAGAIVADRLWKRYPADKVKRELRDHVRRIRQQGLRRDYRWALRDVGFSIEPGESLGLVGANGSGKTTLLRLLIGVTEPHAGSASVGGRVGAIIEVKAGIHPDLTGRENVFLYGTLLGLRRREVARRFDDIVAFAELEEAIDRQVKFYSSGMQMRLGFAVSAFLDPDVLMVDEVLAVGDATFQQRCLDRMRAVMAEGTTLVFVSHDLAAVENTCDRGIWLNQGVVAAAGPIDEVMGAYRAWVDSSSTPVDLQSELRLVDARVISASNGNGGSASQNGASVHSFEPTAIELVVTSDDHPGASVCLGISEGTASPTIFLRRDLPLSAGETTLRCDIGSLPLPGGHYSLWVGVMDKLRKRDLLPWHPAAKFDVSGPALDKTPSGIVRLAPVHVESRWQEHSR